MKKSSFLFGISLSSILAVTGANAAGYTCEELIEYTSCNTGYALADGDCIRTCDAGYFLSGTDCEICSVGSYSLAGASECTTCPTTGMVDSSGKEVVATTASAGAGSISSCIIPTNVTFKDNAGYYHFKSNCAYSGSTPGVNNVPTPTPNPVPSISSEEECLALGASNPDLVVEWEEHLLMRHGYGCRVGYKNCDEIYNSELCFTSFNPWTPTTESECNAYKDKADWQDWGDDGMVCNCGAGGWYIDEDGLDCLYI